MAEEQDCRKGQNLEMIVSKLAKDKPANGLGNLILISGVNIQNLTCPTDDDEEEEPDLHQCGKCKQMFMDLERYLRHRTGKQCRKRPPESLETSDDSRSPNNVPEVVQMASTVPVNSFQEYETEQQDMTNKRKHDRKGVARKRTHGMLSERTNNMLPSGEQQTKRVNIDRLQEIIHPEYTNITPYIGMMTSRGNYASESVIPNNNDLYALMELTKNSGIKEAEGQNETGQRNDMLNGEVITNYYSLPPLSSGLQARLPSGPLIVSHHKSPLAAMTSGPPHILPYPTPGAAGVDPNKGVPPLKRRYKCEKCSREFNQRANLRRHQLVHSGEKPFECVQCQRRFQQQGDLKRHMLRHAEGATYPCHVCDKKFMRIDRFKVHLKAHVDAGELPELPEGDLGFAEEQNGTSGDNEDLIAGPKPPLLPSCAASSSSSSHHTCSKCNQAFIEPDELLVHTCAEPDQVASTTTPLESTQKLHNDVTMAVGIGRTMAADADHSRTYSSSRSGSKGKLTNPHKCPLCNAYYKNVDSLKTHILKHSGEKKYKCDQCPKAFFTSSNLKIHKRIHSGDKPLKCKICLKAFSDPSNFNKHKKSHIKGKIDGVRGPGKRSKVLKGSALLRDIKEEQGLVIKQEQQGVAEGSSRKPEDHMVVGVPSMGGVAMEFGSQTRDFVQSQYEALLPALGGEGTAVPDEEQKNQPEESEPSSSSSAVVPNEEDVSFPMPFIESPSF